MFSWGQLPNPRFVHRHALSSNHTAIVIPYPCRKQTMHGHDSDAVHPAHPVNIVWDRYMYLVEYRHGFCNVALPRAVKAPEKRARCEGASPNIDAPGPVASQPRRRRHPTYHKKIEHMY